MISPLSFCPSPLDSDRFGVTVQRSSLGQGGSASEYLLEYRSHPADLTILRTPLLNSGERELLAMAGFACLERRETWMKILETPPPAPENVNLVLAMPQDVDPVRTAARACFANYGGHYHSDPRLADELCTEAYADWAATLCANHGPDSLFLICRDESGAVLGFGEAHRESVIEARFELTGVVPSHRGRGIHYGMLLRRMQWAYELGCTTVSVRGHSRNDDVRRNWARAGFRHTSTELTWHGWR